MATQNNYIPSTDQNISFLSINDGKSQRHDLIGWSVNADNEASPILFPVPGKNAKIVYLQGSSGAPVDLATGRQFANIEIALEQNK